MQALEVLLARAECDAKIIVAAQRALGAMELIQGGCIEIEGVRGRLNLGGEIEGLKEVFELLSGNGGYSCAR
ncbi:MAG TPA: hypothetical protein VGA09_00120 [Candidatus Binatia bacterium]